jgi:hypothetical protein
VRLTSKGKREAIKAGIELASRVIPSDETVRFIVSPYWRTIQVGEEGEGGEEERERERERERGERERERWQTTSVNVYQGHSRREACKALQDKLHIGFEYSTPRVSM